MKVLIAGCGDLGTALGLQLTDADHQVWGVRRRPELLPLPIHGIAADLSIADGLPEMPEVDVVVYALAADTYTDEAYERAYVAGVRHLLAAYDGRLPSRWLHVSSTSVYAQTGGVWVDETSATAATSFGGRRLLEGELLVSGSALQSTILRLAGIYGPGRTRLLDQVRRGEAVCFDPPVHTNRIHAADAVGAMRHLLTIDDPASVYLGVDHQPVPDGRVKRWLAKRLGVAEPSIGPRPARGRAMRSDKRCSNRRLVDSGYSFRHPDFRSGYGAMIDRMGIGKAAEGDRDD